MTETNLASSGYKRDTVLLLTVKNFALLTFLQSYCPPTAYSWPVAESEQKIQMYTVCIEKNALLTLRFRSLAECCTSFCTEGGTKKTPKVQEIFLVDRT